MTILAAAKEAAGMVHHNTSKRSKAKTILRLPDLEQSKTAVLHSLGAASSQESYRHAIDEFISWYEVDEKNDQIAHHRIVAGRGILRNLGRNNNSPATR